MEWPDILFPSLIVCGLFGVILVVGIGCSYLGLVWLNRRATKCPECGRVGAGELVESQVVDTKVYTDWKGAGGIFARGSGWRKPARVVERTYEDRLECKYCGHQWVVTAQQRESAARHRALHESKPPRAGKL